MFLEGPSVPLNGSRVNALRDFVVFLTPFDTIFRPFDKKAYIIVYQVEPKKNPGCTLPHRSAHKCKSTYARCPNPVGLLTEGPLCRQYCLLTLDVVAQKQSIFRDRVAI